MSSLLSSTVSSCSKAARGFISAAGSTRLRAAVGLAPLAALAFALACSESAEHPTAPSPSNVSIPGPALGVSVASNGLGACLLKDAQDAGYINNVTSLNCTSNDVDISFATITRYRINGGSFQDLAAGTQIACVPGDVIDAVTTAFIANSANERYDFGLWINPTPDSSAYTGSSCIHFNLIPNSNGAVEIDETPDQCGDIAGSDTVAIPLDTLHLTCPGGGKTSLSVDACAAWSNGTTGANDRICPAPAAPNVATGFRWGTTPGTTAKCRCEPLVLPIDVKGVLRIEKQTLPDGAVQSFTFTPNYNSGTTFNLSDGQTNNSPPLSAGTYTAAETVPSGWTLSNRECHVTGTATSKSFTSITNGVSVALGAGDDITCVFTNSRNPTLTVTKVCAPTTDNGKFNLRIDGTANTAGTDALCGGSTGAVEVSIGSHTASETAGTGTSLTNYATPVIGGDCASNGSVTLAAGDAKTCTITNTRLPRLTVTKICVPTTDAGKFNLRIDGTANTAGTDALCGGSTGEVVTTIGSHTVSETAGTGTNLSNYGTPAIGGDCASNGSITLAAGDNKTCTITNTRNATLTVTKVCVPTSDNGKFNLRIDGTANTAGTDALCGGSTGAVTVSATTHTVSETAGTGTSLANYATPVIGGDCASDGTVTLAPGDNKTCTITNTRLPKLTVTKVCVPTNDNGKFNLRIDGTANTAGTDALCGGSTGAVVTSIGSHSVSETAGTGTSLTNYATPVIGGDCASDGSITLAAGDNKTCTITNTRLPKLTVTKICVPTSDNGKFNLRIDGTANTAGTDASCGGSTGAVVTTVGSHTVSETAGTNTDLANYDKVIGGDCASDGSITLAAGDNKTCSITNSKLPSLTVVKTVIGTGATFDFTGTGTGVSAAFQLSPASNASAQTTFAHIAIGAKSITETLHAGYVLTGLGCDKGSTIYDPLVTQTVNTTLAYGDSVTCTYQNEEHVGLTTRTQGFWATHTSLANLAWFGGTDGVNTFAGVADHIICTKVIDDLPKLMGGFWSGISQMDPKGKRSSLDQARMRLLQQLLAAELNYSAFGSLPSMSFATAEAAFCGTDITAINNAASIMAAFNESGDSGAFTPGMSADAKHARTIANLGFWNSLP